MNAHKLTITTLLSLIISLGAALGPRAASAEFNLKLKSSTYTQLVKRSQRGEDRTSRDRRRDTHVQMSAHLSVGPLIGQAGADFDYVLDEQLTIGLSSVATIFAFTGEINKNLSVHLKYFIGNSFYIKPAIGHHHYESEGYEEVPDISREGISARLEIGNEWYFTDHFGMNLSYGAIGFIYHGEDKSVFETASILPSIRFFGAF